MRYIGMTFGFIRKNFVKLFLCALLPAVLLSFVFNPATVFRFFISIHEGNFSSFGQIYAALNDVHSGGKVVLLIVTALICAVMLSVMVDIIQRKMRYGNYQAMGFRSFFSKVNDYFIPLILSALVIIVIVELLGLLLSVFAFFWLRFSATVATVLMVLTVVLLTACALILLTFLFETLPNMSVRGFGLLRSMKLSATRVVGKFWRVFASFIVPFMITMIPMCVNISFEYPGDVYVGYFLTLLFYLFSCVYYMPLFYTVFFDLEELEREDLEQEASVGGEL